MAFTLIVILILAVSGAYVVARYVLPESRERTEPRRLSPTLGFVLWLLCVLAACPWLTAAALGDPLPAGLQAAGEAAARGATLPSLTTTPPAAPGDALPPAGATPTATPLPPTPTPTPEPPVTGVALRDLLVYTCPGGDARFATASTIAAGQQFEILGWNERDGSKWYLVQDDGVGPQQWVAGSVSVDPPNFADYIGRATCRVAQ